MLRPLSLLAFVALVGCTAANDPAANPDPAAEENVDSGKDDGLPAASISPRLAPLVALLRDDKNLAKELGPEGTDAINVKKRVKVVKYTEFGKAVDVAARTIANKYTVDVNGTYRRGNGLVDLISVGDMYVTIKTGYGDDSFIDKLIVAPKRAMAKQLSSAILPEGAMVQADHASTTSTGNYVVVLGDITSSQAIVMSVEYEIN
jgi:hypothetical protein